MARNYAQVMCAIWDSEEFIALSEGAQRAYFLLMTQKDISAAGVLRMWTPLWASLSRTSTEASLKVSLSELKAAKFIVPDWVTGELLVRTFVKWDGGYKNSKRRPLIIREAQSVRSLEIKSQLRVEFEKLGLPTAGLPEPPPPAGSDAPPDTPSDRASGTASDAGRDSMAMGVGSSSSSLATALTTPVEAASGAGSTVNGHRPPGRVFPQVDRASDAPADTTSPSEGVVGTSVVSTGDPQTQNPQPVPPTAGSGSAGAIATTAQTLVGEWIDLCRKRPPKATIGHTSKAIKEMLAEGIDPSDIRAGISAWTAKGLHPAALASVVNEVMNGSVVPFTRPGKREHTPWQNPDPSEYLAPDAWGTP
jgi:hypothetical protein